MKFIKAITAERILGGLIFILPFLFLPITVEFYDFNKQAVIFISFVFILLFWSIKIYYVRKVEVSVSKISLFLLLFVFSVWISYFVNSPTQESLFSALGPITMSTLYFLFFFFSSLLNTENEEKIIRYVVYVGLAFSLVVLVQQTGLTPAVFNFFSFPPWISSTSWSPAGFVSDTAIFLAIVLGFCFSYLLIFFKNLKGNLLRDWQKQEGDISSWEKTIYKLAFITIGIVITLSMLIVSLNSYIAPINNLRRLGNVVGTKIALKNFTNPGLALFGVGPDRSKLAISYFRPKELSTTAVGKLFFVRQSNLFTHIFTEYGALGLLSFALLIFYIYFKVLTRHNKLNYLLIPLSAYLLLGLFLMPSLLGMVFFFINLTLINIYLSKKININLGQSDALFILLLFIIVLCTLFMYFLGKIYLAEVYFKQALESQKNKVTLNTYNSIFRAISLNTTSTQYHIFLSNISSSSLAEILKKKNPSPDEERLVQFLLKQAIDEAKKAIDLDPKNAIYLNHLGETYLKFTNKIKNAEMFALGYFNQALEHDPNNSYYLYNRARLNHKLKELDKAQMDLERIIDFEPTFGIGYFELYLVLKEKREFYKAYDALQKAQQNVDQAEPLYINITKEIYFYKRFLQQLNPEEYKLSE